MPLVILILVMLLLFGIYLHDRAVLYAAALESVQENGTENTEEREMLLRNYMKEIVLMTDVQEVTLMREKTALSVSYRGEFRLKNAFFLNLILKDHGIIRGTITKKSTRHAAEMLRFLRAVRGKGTNEFTAE